MAFAAASDLLTMKIPNWLTGGLVLAFPLVALLTGLDLSTLLYHVLAGVILLAAGMAMFAPGWMGGGDAKLLAGVALWFGLSSALVNFLLIAAIAGGALTLAFLAMRSIPLPAFTLTWDWLQRLHNKKSGIPYGIALASAGLVVYQDSGIGRSLISLAG
ncbi:peptidase [Microvirga sp. KLBC 81]|nr:peptidase [Microvirga sp. KLBC 81]